MCPFLCAHKETRITAAAGGLSRSETEQTSPMMVFPGGPMGTGKTSAPLLLPASGALVGAFAILGRMGKSGGNGKALHTGGNGKRTLYCENASEMRMNR